jgi:5-methyltetrahydropteroyltriglutamate--homocysteine methyltransferase
MTAPLNHKPLLTHEVGSLDKPGWRVKAYAGKPLDDKDLEEARSWGERVTVPEYEKLLDLLRHAPFSKEQKGEIQRWSSLYALRLEESAGLDVVYDGEQQRTEMYDWAVNHTNGFERRGSVRAFDNKYYSKAAVIGPISLREPFHNKEFSYLVSVADAEVVRRALRRRHRPARAGQGSPSQAPGGPARLRPRSVPQPDPPQP